MEKLIKPTGSIENLSEKEVEAFCEKNGNLEYCDSYLAPDGGLCSGNWDASSDKDDDILF